MSWWCSGRSPSSGSSRRSCSTTTRSTRRSRAPRRRRSPRSDETASPAPTEPVELARGTFISREHETTGTARILRLADGQQILRLEGFETSNGPALFVYLSQNPADGDDGSFDDDYIDLGELKGNIGDQNYVIPAEIDPLGYTSVVVWCDRFNVSFGAADIAASDA